MLAVALVVLGGAAPVGAARAPVDLEFRPVIDRVPSVAATPTTTVPVDVAVAKAAIAACDDAAVAQLTVIPTTTAAAADPAACVVFPDRDGGKRAERYYLGPAGLTGRGLRNARAEFVPGQGWTIKVDMTRAGAKAWDALARAQFHQNVAISVQGHVVSAPQIQPSDAKFTSFDGIAVISGNSTQKQAAEMATIVRLAIFDARH